MGKRERKVGKCSLSHQIQGDKCVVRKSKSGRGRCRTKEFLEGVQLQIHDIHGISGGGGSI